MADIDSLQAGDILCVRDGKSFVARGITWWMRLWKKRNHVYTDKTYHHNARIIDIWGELYVSEANARGMTCLHLQDAYTEQEWADRIDVMRPVVPYSPAERAKICRLSANYSLQVTRYDYFNFIFHIVEILSGWWIGPTGKRAEKKLYCSEVVATVENKVRCGSFPEPAMANPMNVSLNPHFRYA